jgi:hypothetical protein
MRAIVTIVVAVVVGGLAWKHFTGSLTAFGHGLFPATRTHRVNRRRLRPARPPVLGANPGLSTLVAREHSWRYLAGDEAATTLVDCPAVSRAATETMQTRWGANGPFYDCAVTLTGGSKSVECWLQDGGAYMMVFLFPNLNEGPGVHSLKTASCESLAGTKAPEGVTDPIRPP